MLSFPGNFLKASIKLIQYNLEILGVLSQNFQKIVEKIILKLFKKFIPMNLKSSYTSKKYCILPYCTLK